MGKFKFRAWWIKDEGEELANPMMLDMNDIFNYCDPRVPVENGDIILMQYTGLNDKTKWEDLTQEEKQRFYNSNCSKDGKTIKYHDFEHIKHLWKGKEIYEGDILEDQYGTLYKIEFEICKYVANRLDGKGGTFITPGMCEWKIKGNIYENSELLEGE